MNTMIPILQISAAITFVAWLVDKREDWGLYRLLVVLNMVLISVFAKKLISFGDYTSNIGNVFYAFAALLQSVVIVKYGKLYSWKILRAVLISVILVGLSGKAIATIDPIQGNEGVSSAINLIANTQFSVMAASFMANLIAITSFILIYDYLNVAHKFNKVARYIISIAALQVIDSLVFFPIAFANSDWVGIMLVGLVFKTIMVIALTPVFLYLTRESKQLTN